MNDHFSPNVNTNCNEISTIHDRHRFDGALAPSSSSSGIISPQHKHYPQHHQNGVMLDSITAASLVPSPCTGSWPHHVAVGMAESIQKKVRKMLGKSRLVRKTSEIQFLKSSDILQVHSVLGSGAFSQVTCVTARTRPLQRYACKHLKQDLMADTKGFMTAASELAFEAHILSSFDHPNIIKIQGWAANGIASFEEGKHNSFFLLLDLLDETLDQRIDQWKVDPPRTIASQHARRLEKLYALSEIASALDYIHSHGVVFRDLKPQNIGFLKRPFHSSTTPKYQVKLFDFGLSRELPMLDTTLAFKMSGKVGTIRYMAPEVCLYQPYGIACDIYSWSMVAYEILSQTKPFEGFTPEMYCTYVCQQHVRPSDAIARHCNAYHRNNTYEEAIPNELFLILEHAWSPVPSHRAGLGSICAQLNLFAQKEQLLLEAQELHLFRHRQSEHQGLTATTNNAQATMTSTTTQSLPPPPPPVHTVSPDMHHPGNDAFRQHAYIHQNNHQQHFHQQQSCQSYIDDSIDGNSFMEEMDVQQFQPQHVQEHQQQHHFFRFRQQNRDYQTQNTCNNVQQESMSHVVDLTKEEDEHYVMPVRKLRQPRRKSIVNKQQQYQQQQQPYYVDMPLVNHVRITHPSPLGNGNSRAGEVPRLRSRSDEGCAYPKTQRIAFDGDKQHFYSMRTEDTDIMDDDDNSLFEW